MNKAITFSGEFEARLRRVCGVDDDTATVTYELDSDTGNCDTCDYGARAFVYVSIRNSDGVRTVSREFEDLGALIRALDDIELAKEG